MPLVPGLAGASLSARWASHGVSSVTSVIVAVAAMTDCDGACHRAWESWDMSHMRAPAGADTASEAVSKSCHCLAMREPVGLCHCVGRLQWPS